MAPSRRRRLLRQGPVERSIRSATYAARWVAKNVVAAGIAQRCEIQLAYAIGRARPIGLYVDTFGTASVPEERIADAIREVFDLRPPSA